MSFELSYIISHLCRHGPSKYTTLFDMEHQALELGLKKGDSHCFRTRCHVILLKADGRNSKDIGLITGMSNISINHWVSRFKSDDISGSHNRAGQGRKPVLNCNTIKIPILTYNN